MKRIFFTLLLLSLPLLLPAQETHAFVERDGKALCLDIHRPAAGAETTLDGVAKPTVLFVFGGGFIGGRRNDPFMDPWNALVTGEGYTLVTVDYRLGMKDYQVGKGLRGLMKASKQFELSQQMGVEDVFAAISYLKEHPELGVDADNVVLVGSSAGAIISLASAYAVANGTAPEGLTLRGVMSFAGAIISTSGKPKFETLPCPIAMFHGTADGAVAYDHTGAFGMGIWGSNYLAKQFEKKGWDFQIWRFDGYSHDVASYMENCWSIEKDFLENDVIRRQPRKVDALVSDPALPHWGDITLDSLY